MIKKYDDFLNEASKFSFKTEKPTGRYSSFSNNSYLVKLDNKQVGQITFKGEYGTEGPPYKVMLMITKDETHTDNNPNCPWKWVTLKKECQTLDEMKKWLNDNFAGITAKWNLHKLN